MASLTDIWNKYRKWCRLVVLLHEDGETVCKDILCEIGVKNVMDGVEIYQKLEPYKETIRKMYKYQQKVLLPDDKVTNTAKLDFALTTHIIEILDTRKKHLPIKELRDVRNELFHKPDHQRDMTEEQFSKYWNQISQLLTRLGYDMNQLIGLKTVDQLSERRKKIVEDIRPYIKGNI